MDTLTGNWKTLKAGTTETENGNGKGKKSAHAQYSPLVIYVSLPRGRVVVGVYVKY